MVGHVFVEAVYREHIDSGKITEPLLITASQLYAVQSERLHTSFWKFGVVRAKLTHPHIRFERRMAARTVLPRSLCQATIQDQHNRTSYQHPWVSYVRQ